MKKHEHWRLTTIGKAFLLTSVRCCTSCFI